MKKHILFASAVLFVLGAVTFSGCKKDDTTPPVITLNGSSSMSQALPATAGAGSFTDPGATANDDEDGDITVTSSGTVDANTKGTYTITYTATDAAGNSASATRGVTIVNDAEAFGGSYMNCADTCTGPPVTTALFNSTVTVSSTVNGQVSINNFGAFGTSINIIATISGSTISIATGPSQSLGGPAYITAVYPAGTSVVSASAPTKFKVNYQWTDGALFDVCQTWYVR